MVLPGSPGEITSGSSHAAREPDPLQGYLLIVIRVRGVYVQVVSQE